MSCEPSPPARSEPKYRVVPSHDREARRSLTALFTPLPRFVGVDHGAVVDVRVDVHRSRPPRPPALFESKKISSPSRRRFGRKSSWALLRPVTGTGVPNVLPSNALT